MLVHYVEFYQPGALFPESTVRKVKDRIPANLSRIPGGTYSLFYYDREERKVTGEKLTGKDKNESVRIIFGKTVPLSDIPNTPDKRILRSNIESNGYHKQAILCNTGNWQALDKGDIVLDSYQDLKSLVTPF